MYKVSCSLFFLPFVLDHDHDHNADDDGDHTEQTRLRH